MYELEFFYNEQLDRMQRSGMELYRFNDCLCQLLDMVKPRRPGQCFDRRYIAISFCLDHALCKHLSFCLSVCLSAVGSFGVQPCFPHYFFQGFFHLLYLIGPCGFLQVLYAAVYFVQVQLIVNTQRWDSRNDQSATLSHMEVKLAQPQHH